MKYGLSALNCSPMLCTLQIPQSISGLKGTGQQTQPQGQQSQPQGGQRSEVLQIQDLPINHSTISISTFTHNVPLYASYLTLHHNQSIYWLHHYSCHTSISNAGRQQLNNFGAYLCTSANSCATLGKHHH